MNTQPRLVGNGEKLVFNFSFCHDVSLTMRAPLLMELAGTKRQTTVFLYGPKK